MHWILPCTLFVAVNSFSVTGNIEVRNSQNSSGEESMVDGIINELKGMCLLDNNNRTTKEIMQDTQKIVNNMVMYKDIVKLNKQLKDEIQWIVKESGDEQLVSRIFRLMKRDTKEICGNEIAKDCTELQKYELVSGVYKIYPHNNFYDVDVYCDMSTVGGGWTVIQRRLDGSVNFQRTWTDYENGFGDLNGEYWLGNKHINSLTSSGKYELRINLTDLSNTKKYAVYKTFVVGDAASKYKLTIGNYSGNAGDKMVYHNGMKFSTTDQDNDEGGTCVGSYGPWWHKNCCHSGLNKAFKSNLYWGSFRSNAAKTSVLMIRKM
ncbi:fibrinogen-like protein A [Mytilus californianus]|uniref:fibrinogen-like protein A n=1 Tax=Mytilus californianus TaxID=6549 RepID=UPI002245D0C0|nr:fibrinogen-like protein A [Mytilus californianus]